ncbi:MAG: CD225/dispanin family protein [Muribaculaceae bacterium]|nr:CD225/dispanin family protein [Muribaculaceae bacterium]
MKYWLILNNQQVGPFETDQMWQVDFNALTPVWYEGLPDWVQARDVEELRAIIIQREASRMNHYNRPVSSAEHVYVQPVEEYSVEMNAEPVREQPAQFQSNVSPMAKAEERPSNYLVWAIIVTILCNIIMGVIAIIFASKVNTAFDRGDVVGARCNSDRAQWFIIFAIVLGVIWSPFQVALAML